MKQKTQPKASPPDAVLVVRRGARRRFEALMDKTADLPAVVTWDRRKMERRASSTPADIDQRKSERRQKPPFTWEVADFVVLEGPPQNADSKRRMAKAARSQTAKKKRA